MCVCVCVWCVCARARAARMCVLRQEGKKEEGKLSFTCEKKNGKGNIKF